MRKVQFAKAGGVIGDKFIITSSDPLKGKMGYEELNIVSAGDK